MTKVFVLRNMYLNAILGLFSMTSAVNPLTGWKVSPPKLTLISHTINGDSIDVNTNSSLHLKCSGEKAMSWSLPNNNQQYETVSEPQIRSLCDDNKIPKCTTDVVIPEVTYAMTGYYTCHYEGSTVSENSDSIYIYVNDPNELIVPYEGSTDFMLVAVLQSHPVTIPCKATNSRAKVSLWKTSSVLKEVIVNNTLGISFNPKKGYHFEYPRWDSDNSILECKVELDGNEQISQIHIHWSILPNELYPLIDDSKAKNVFLNRTFTLKCFVHIDLGVIIYMSWDVPNSKSGRVTETAPETNRIELKGNSYDTVSTNLTVTGAQKEDEGTYYCNITDVRGRVFSASKRITVYENGLPPSYVNFSMDINNNKPLILKVGEMVRFVVGVETFPDLDSVQLFWFKNDILIEKNNKHYVTNVSTLKVDGPHHQAFLSIKSIDVEDSGTYMLLGNTSDMNTNITMQLLVRGPPSIKILNIVEFYEFGKPYELECVATGYPKSSVWWKWFGCQSTDNCLPTDESDWIDVNHNWNSSLLSNSEHLFQPDISQEYLNQMTLQVIANQTGAYSCFASNDNTTIVHKQISFIVTDAINGFSILSSTEEPTVMDDITLTCKASVYNYTDLNWIRKPLDENIDDYYVEHNLTDLIESSEKDEYSITLSIKLRSVQINDSGNYVCEAITKDNERQRHQIDFKLDIRNISGPALIDSNMKGEVIEKAPYTQLELRCLVSGRPKPTISWFRDDKPFIVSENTGIKLEDRNQKLIFSRILDKDSGNYQCKATNRGGTVWRSARIKVDSYDETTNALTSEEIIVFVLFVLVGTVMIFMAIYIGKKIRQERKQKRELEFFSHNLFETGQIEMFNPDMPLDEQIELLPYDPRYEFPKERLKLGRTLGQGAFGRVVKAEAIGLEDGETSTTVAVKMLKERADINQRKALMAELKILIHLGRHLNIVNLLGAVTKNLVKGELLVIVEYCKYGNLRHYLLAYRDSYVNQLNPDTGLIDPSIKTVHNSKKQSNCKNGRSPVYENVFAANGIANPNYTNSQITSIDTKKETVRYADILHNQQSSGSFSNGYIASVNSNGNTDTGQDSNSANCSNGYRGEAHHKRNKDRVVTTCDLLCFAFQCARGMQYLAHRKLIHRDLAARNVLLAEDNIVKICDFGLAKDVYKYDNYVKKNDGPLPIKWMAIESIRDKVFTSKSDVWSFGVLLYEFFTLGGNPYPGIEIDEEFYKRLKSGYRMERPDFAPKEVYELMTHCWNAEPKDRPDFMEIADIIGALLESNVRQHYLDLNDPYQEMNEQILNNNDYLRMSSMLSSSRNEVNGDYLNMKSNDEENERKSDPMKHYDNLGHIRPIDGTGRLPVEPMEVVPMIQLDTYGQRYDHKVWEPTNIADNKQSDYLTMDSNNCLIGIKQSTVQNNHNYSSNSSEVCLPPPYSHVI